MAYQGSPADHGTEHGTDRDTDRGTTPEAASGATQINPTEGEQEPIGTSQLESADMASSDEFLGGLDVDSNDTDTDADSAITDVFHTSSTASVRSSIYRFVEDNGRTYHSYKQGKYLLPNDDTEQERLDLQHQLWLLVLKQKLHLAPVSNPQRVLDVGTGTGIWAIDFATQNPSAEVIGTDLSPIQPPFVPPNCRFEVDDAEDDWTFNQKFDFVHGRLLFSAFGSPAKMIQNAFNALAPGGYLEMQEVYAKLYSVDGTTRGTALEKWCNAVVEGAKELGRDWRCTVKYKQCFIDAGFEDVVEERFPGPLGTWPKNKDDKLIGLYWTANLLDGINAMSNVTIRKGLGWSNEDMELLLVDARRDIKDRKIHGYWPMHVIYGRKPK